MTYEERPATFEVNYEINADDVLAFSRHNCRSSRTMRRLRVGGYTFITLLLLFGDIVQLWVRRFLPWEYLLPVVGRQVLELVLFVGIYYLALRWVVKFTASNLSKESRNAGVMCKHKVVISDEALVETTDVGEQRVLWRGVDRVEENESHIFIYTAPATAHVIPKWAFATNREAEEFFQAARTYHLRAA